MRSDGAREGAGREGDEQGARGKRTLTQRRRAEVPEPRARLRRLQGSWGCERVHEEWPGAGGHSCFCEQLGRLPGQVVLCLRLHLPAALERRVALEQRVLLGKVKVPSASPSSLAKQKEIWGWKVVKREAPREGARRSPNYT